MRAKSKTLKALKTEVKNQLDAFIGDSVCDDVEVTCTDKDCLLNSILEKINFFVNGDITKEIATGNTVDGRNLETNQA